jgi:hypothetical protein
LRGQTFTIERYAHHGFDPNVGVGRTMEWVELWSGSNYGVGRTMEWVELWSGSNYGVGRTMEWVELWSGSNYGRALMRASEQVPAPAAAP